MRPNFDLSLYLVTDRSLSLGRSLEDVIEEAVQGGVTMVQLREKDCSSSEFYQLAVSLKKILTQHNIPLIINDRLDIALACNAEGLHIGQSDLPYLVARRLMGNDRIIGLSVESVEDVIEANKLDVDYIGISPVFDTSTKLDTATALGFAGVRELSRLSIHPSVGIGGINASNVKDIIECGADGVSVVSVIMSATDPRASAYELFNIIKQAKNNKT